MHFRNDVPEVHIASKGAEISYYVTWVIGFIFEIGLIVWLNQLYGALAAFAIFTAVVLLVSYAVMWMTKVGHQLTWFLRVCDEHMAKRGLLLTCVMVLFIGPVGVATILKSYDDSSRVSETAFAGLVFCAFWVPFFLYVWPRS